MLKDCFGSAGLVPFWVKLVFSFLKGRLLRSGTFLLFYDFFLRRLSRLNFAALRLEKAQVLDVLEGRFLLYHLHRVLEVTVKLIRLLVALLCRQVFLAHGRFRVIRVRSQTKQRFALGRLPF